VLSHVRCGLDDRSIATFDSVSQSAQTDGIAVSDVRFPLPQQADNPHYELETLIKRVVEETIAKLARAKEPPFIKSTPCAELLGVSPEHLCAMRARGEGPPWSGDGKWIRYRRSDVLDWIANLPRQAC
jgi:hypothetical protein